MQGAVSVISCRLVISLSDVAYFRGGLQCHELVCYCAIVLLCYCAIAEQSFCLATSSGILFGCHQTGNGDSKCGDKDTHHFGCTSDMGTLLHRSPYTSRIDRCTIGSSLALTAKMSHSRTP